MPLPKNDTGVRWPAYKAGSNLVLYMEALQCFLLVETNFGMSTIKCFIYLGLLPRSQIFPIPIFLDKIKDLLIFSLL